LPNRPCPGFEVSLRYGVVAPAGTPPSDCRALNKDLDAALATAEVQKRILSAGGERSRARLSQYAE